MFAYQAQVETSRALKNMLSADIEEHVRAGFCFDATRPASVPNLRSSVFCGTNLVAVLFI